MEIDPMLFWNIVLSVIVLPCAWAFKTMFVEINRLQVLLNRTREDYAKRDDVKEDIKKVIDSIHRLESKIDRLQERSG